MEENETSSRGKWKSKTEAILSCIGYAVGFGNVWRFPYLAYKNGGGAFLVPYLMMLFLCGIPLFFMESSLGQFSSTGCITVFKICPLFKGAGYAIIIVNMIASTYFNIIDTYPIMFLTYAFNDPLPWAGCDNHWNTKDCIKLKVGGARTQVNDSFYRNSNRTTVKTPADEFFHIEEIGSIDGFLLLCNIISWIIVYLCIMRGIQSVGKVIYFTALFPFVILFILLVRGLTLPGAWDGIYFYIWPEWNQLGNLKVWADAALQIFFSLGPGWGGIVNISSYNEFKNNCKLDAVIVPIVNCGTSILAGFVVFSVIGFMAHETGMPISTVATGGPGLAFITYPAAISLMPWPNLWASGMYWLQLFDWYAASISVVVICLSEVIIVGWTYGIKRFIRDIEFMTGEKLSWYWTLSWKIITPLFLTFIFVTVIAFNTKVSYLGHEFPEWAIQVGWGSCFVSIACIPMYMGYRLLFVEKGDLKQRLVHSLEPLPDWGPAQTKDRLKWTRKTLKSYLKGAGYAIIVVNMIASTFSIIVITYPLMFLMYAFKDPLPWSTCNNHWNTKKFGQMQQYRYFILWDLVGEELSIFPATMTSEITSGLYWLQLFDWYSASISVVLICLSEVIIVGWTYGVKRFIRDVEFMTAEKLSWFWILSWKFITPLYLMFIIIAVISFSTRISYLGHEFPEWAIQVGWGSCSASIACIPLYMGYRLIYIEKGDSMQETWKEKNQ
nr:unnamed protein product [Callosobruchus chinensis]